MRLLGSVNHNKNGKLTVNKATWDEFEEDPTPVFITEDLPAGPAPQTRVMPAPVDAGSIAKSLQRTSDSDGEGGSSEEIENLDRQTSEARQRLADIQTQIDEAGVEHERIHEEIEMLKHSREELSHSLHEETELLLQQAKDEAEVKARELVRDAENQRERLLEEAREESARTRKDAFADAYAKGETQGHEDGFRSGFEAGRKQSARDNETLLTSLKSALDKSNSLLADVAKESEGQIISLALAIARKVIQREIMLDPKATADMIRSALRKVSHRKDFFVKVSPVDIETLKAQEDYIRQDLLQAQTFQIISDSRIEPGSCLIETEAGSVEASIANQLAFIEEQLQTINGSAPT